MCVSRLYDSYTFLPEYSIHRRGCPLRTPRFLLASSDASPPHQQTIPSRGRPCLGILPRPRTRVHSSRPKWPIVRRFPVSPTTLRQRPPLRLRYHPRPARHRPREAKERPVPRKPLFPVFKAECVVQSRYDADSRQTPSGQQREFL